MSSFYDKILAFKIEANAAITKISSLEELDVIKIKYLGKKGIINSELRHAMDLPNEEKRICAQALNQIKTELGHKLNEKLESLKQLKHLAQIEKEREDVTLPVFPEYPGRLHLVNSTIDSVVRILSALGFESVYGPEVEDDFHNFTALNTPLYHPAREMQDSFYFDGGFLLRTHTSPMQIRAMTSGRPPFKIIAPGRVYRRDLDSTHTPMFHQIEWLWIDTHVNMSHLIGCIDYFLKKFFANEDLAIRLRPSFFPFTEPSAEVDIKLSDYGRGWMEVMGCGMVHPSVLRNVGLDDKKYQGFAAGLGVERFTMLKHKIDDIRSFFDSDIGWLSHYGKLPFAT